MLRYLFQKSNNSPVPEQPQELVKPQRIVEIPFCELEIVKKSLAHSKEGDVQLVKYKGETLVLKPGTSDVEIHVSIPPHPRIVSIRGYVTGHGILLEYMARGTLESYIASGEPLTGKQIVHIALDIATGMLHLHAHRFLYRDLALRNILLCNEEETGDELRAKLCDFGWSTRLKPGDSVYTCNIVSAPWKILPPEVALNGTFSCAGDVWSFGISLFSLLARERPFNGKNTTETKEMLIKGEYPDVTPEVAAQNPFITKIMRQCLQKDCEARPSFQMLVTLLQEYYTTI